MQQKGFTVWFTGLPCSGKSTLAHALKQRLGAIDLPVEILDGDEVRTRLTKGLGFSKADRDENIRRIAYVAKLLSRARAVAIVAAVSPYREIRDEARAEITHFVEIHVDCPLEECIRRDVKGMYAKAMNGEIANFTGVSDPYEPPLRPDVTVKTGAEEVGESLAKILCRLGQLGYIPQHLVEPGMGPEEDQRIVAKLRALGYID
ncbi:adenylylsulfate kinase [Candidatus Methylomirabilis lanthanidiphila]|uniref:Adenylyl-sulfate kinase n=1 Tax=Candidatus Methylomirabilis lanthanidiphila TaxID=2211376 RepID=A0A564ZNF6_9BACT|nr:adenylyl-sulfate kinase [Candidatus Methylomirabilis lanthanidiphila]VUZ86636.1 adenylylsulfate kinase [Candidatus Methylomirabilis lanthanidiphila]